MPQSGKIASNLAPPGQIHRSAGHLIPHHIKGRFRLPLKQQRSVTGNCAQPMAAAQGKRWSRGRQINTLHVLQESAWDEDIALQMTTLKVDFFSFEKACGGPVFVSGCLLRCLKTLPELCTFLHSCWNSCKFWLSWHYAIVTLRAAKHYILVLYSPDVPLSTPLITPYPRISRCCGCEEVFTGCCQQRKSAPRDAGVAGL